MIDSAAKPIIIENDGVMIHGCPSIRIAPITEIIDFGDAPQGLHPNIIIAIVDIMFNKFSTLITDDCHVFWYTRILCVNKACFRIVDTPDWTLHPESVGIIQTTINNTLTKLF